MIMRKLLFIRLTFITLSIDFSAFRKHLKNDDKKIHRGT